MYKLIVSIKHETPPYFQFAKLPLFLKIAIINKKKVIILWHFVNFVKCNVFVIQFPLLPEGQEGELGKRSSRTRLFDNDSLCRSAGNDLRGIEALYGR